MGHTSSVAGVPTYIANPSPSSNSSPLNRSSAVIVILTDLFGYKLPNVQLLADEYARAGFKTLVPDILNDDGMAFDALNSVTSTPQLFEIVGPWLKNHGDETVTPSIDAVLKSLKAEGKKVGLVGFCFGGKYAVQYGATDLCSAVVACHPSFIDVPSMIPGVRVPISFAVAKDDEIYDAATSKKAAQILEENGIPYENRIYAGKGIGHGFAVRGDTKNPVQKAALEEATAQTIAWFQRFL